MAFCAGSACDAIQEMRGFTIGVTADRRAEEQGQLLARRGAEVLYGPAIRTLSWGDADALAEATARVLDEPPDILIANTGMGIRTWLAFAEARGLDGHLLEVLRGARVFARGPKAAGAVTKLGLEVAWQVPEERLDHLVDHLVGEARGLIVAFQLAGSDALDTTAALHAAGARVIEIPVYRWTLPEDDGPALRLAESCIAGSLAAVTFTSSPSVDHFFAISADHGIEDDLRDAFNAGVVCACVGPLTGETATRQGVTAAIWPGRGRLGLMIRRLGEHLHRSHCHLSDGDREIVIQGCAVLADGVEVTLTDRESSVLGVLARRPGAVVSKPMVLREIWGGDGDTDIVDITIGRLRQRLEPLGVRVEVLALRGYRLDVSCA